MSDKQRLVVLVAIMLAISFGAVGACVALLYREGVAQMESWLAYWVEENAEELAVQARAGVPPDKILASLRDTYGTLHEIPGSAELVVGSEDTSGPRILLAKRYDGRELRRGESIQEVPAEPLLRALHGETGTIIARDYHGVMVLAAYGPIPELGWGAVMKVDMSELRAPYWRSGGIGASILALAAVFRFIVFRRFFQPFLKRHAGAQQRFRAAFDSTYQLSVLASVDGTVLDVSAAVCRTFSLDRSWCVNKPLWELRPWSYSVESEAAIKALSSRAATGEAVRQEVQAADCEGALRWYDVSIRRVQWSAAGAILMLESVDVTERRLAELELRRVNRALQCLSDCNQILIRAEDELQLLRDVCEVIHREGEYAFVWVGEVNDDEFGTLQPVAWSGEDRGLLTCLEWERVESYPEGIALLTGEPFMVGDLGQFGLPATWRDAAERSGVLSAVCLPLVHGGSTVGILSMYLREAHTCDDRELELLSEMACDLSYGIGAQRARSAHAAAVRALEASEERLRVALEAGALSIFDWDLHRDKIVWVGSNGPTLRGFDSDTLPFTEAFEKYIHPEDRPSILAELERSRMERCSSEYEYRVCLSTGETRWQLARGRFYYDQPGEAVRMIGGVMDITDYKEMERRLRESEDRYRTLYESSGEGLFLLEGLRIEQCNAQGGRLMGYERHRLYGAPFTDYAPEYQPNGANSVEAFASRARLAEADVPQLFSWSMERANGVCIDTEVSLHACRLHGRVFVQAVVRDVTERSRAESQLHESEARYRGLFHDVPVALWSQDFAGVRRELALIEADGPAGLQAYFRSRPEEVSRFLRLVQSKDMNRAFVELHGAGSEEELLERITETLLPESLEPIGDALAMIAHGHATVDSVIPRRTLQGKYIETLARWSSVAGGNESSPEAMLGVIDVTERNATERALHHAQLLLRSVLDSSPDAVMGARAVRDGNGLIHDFECLLVNAPASRMLRRPKGRLVGKRMHEFVLPELVPQFFNSVVQVVETGAPVDVEVSLQTVDGTRWFRLVAVKMRDGVTATISDLTERKQLQEQYLQSQKMEAVGQLAGGVAHDFNNILTVILATSEFALMQMEEGHPQRDDFHQVLAMAERASALTRQLLAFSRRQIVHMEPVQLNDILRNTQKMLHRLIGENIEVSLTFGEELWTICADAGQMDQVVLNLAVNARDAMPNGGALEIRTENLVLAAEGRSEHVDVPAGEYVLLSVSDTGQGMDAEVQSRIFEPFFTTKAPDKGTGLGLATVYGIVQQSGGSIQVRSEVGRGTTFRLIFPRMAGDFGVARSDGTGEAPPGAETVLLVEDEESVRRLAGRLLESAGYNVLAASNHVDALEFARVNGSSIAVILSDMVMPGLSGLELARELRPLCPGARYLFMSGYPDRVVIKDEILDPATNFIHKPFSRNVLLRKVRDVLSMP